MEAPGTAAAIAVAIMVCGSRACPAERVSARLDADWAARPAGEEWLVLHGGARGADAAAAAWCVRRGVAQRVFAPEWRKFGRSAGVRRNADMVAACARAYAFWDGASPGTRDSIARLAAARKPCVRVNVGDAPAPASGIRAFLVKRARTK